MGPLGGTNFFQQTSARFAKTTTTTTTTDHVGRKHGDGRGGGEEDRAVIAGCDCVS